MQRIRLYGEVLATSSSAGSLLARGTETSGCPSGSGPHRTSRSSNYLQSLFQADGYVSVRRDGGCESAGSPLPSSASGGPKTFSCCSIVLGIYSRRLRSIEPPREPPRPARGRRSESGSERARFRRARSASSGMPSSSKLLRVARACGLKHCPDVREEEIVAIEDSRRRSEVYDIQTESGEYLSNNVAVHNCFILSVEDTMESILDWNTKEGMIFRGGSGSGINLSKIRSSKEQLSKGGLASGPGVVHARRRRLGRHDQVGRQDPARGQDGRARRRPPRHPRLHLVQGARGGQGRGAARGRLRHVDRRRGLPLDPVPEREQLGARDARSSSTRSSAASEWQTIARVTRRAGRHASTPAS